MSKVLLLVTMFGVIPAIGAAIHLYERNKKLEREKDSLGKRAHALEGENNAYRKITQRQAEEISLLAEAKGGLEAQNTYLVERIQTYHKILKEDGERHRRSPETLPVTQFPTSAIRAD